MMTTVCSCTMAFTLYSNVLEKKIPWYFSVLICYITWICIFVKMSFSLQKALSALLFFKLFQKLITKTLLKWIAGTTMPKKTDTVYVGTICVTTKHASLFSKAQFSQSTLQRRNILLLGRVSSKINFRRTKTQCGPNAKT